MVAFTHEETTIISYYVKMSATTFEFKNDFVKKGYSGTKECLHHVLIKRKGLLSRKSFHQHHYKN